MKGIDWVGLIDEVVARTKQFQSPTAAGRLIPVDRQTMQRWWDGGRGEPRGPNRENLLAWARRTLTAEELARYRVPPELPERKTSNGPRRNVRPDQPRRRRP